MRINSPFHDYYDCIQAHGVDQNLVYTRIPVELENFVSVIKEDYSLHKEYGCAPLSYCIYTIGFCGKCWPMIRLSAHSNYKNENLVAHCYSMEDVDTYIEKIASQQALSKRQIECFHNTEKVYRKRNTWPTFLRRMYFEKFFELTKDLTNRKDFFLKHNTPIFISRKRDIDNWREEPVGVTTLHGCLKDFEFYRMVEPFTAYQELQMFLTGVLGLTNQHKAKYQGQLIEPELDDITKRDSKGFDKWSFRKESSKK